MAKPDFGSVDAYIAAQPETAQEALQCVRRAIRKAAPGAEEGISYKMPAYTLPDGPFSISHGGDAITLCTRRQIASSPPSRTIWRPTLSTRRPSGSRFPNLSR